jgi:hypothetical protein
MATYLTIYGFICLVSLVGLAIIIYLDGVPEPEDDDGDDFDLGGEGGEGS